MDAVRLLEAIENISVWQRGDQRAPHKPILLLYAISEYKRGNKVLSYSSVEKPVERILEEILPNRKSIHSHYPFWYLKNEKTADNEKLWIISNDKNIELRKGKPEPLKSELRAENVKAGFSEDVLALFDSNPYIVDEIVQTLLDAHFPRTIQNDVCASLGLSVEGINESQKTYTKKLGRDPGFRERIMTAYRGECAICGYSLRVAERLVGLEAAHIKWHQAGGPDTESNGLSLCSLHHILFDRGAYTVDAELRVRVSDKVSGEYTDGMLDRYNLQRIREPQRSRQFPSQEFLDWHRREVLVGEVL